jgi:hypothetical protein
MEPSIVQEAQVSLWETGLPDRWWHWPVRLLLGIILLLLVWPFVDSLYLRSLAPGKMAARLYRRLYRFGDRIGSPAQPSETPYEFAVALAAQLRAIAASSSLGTYLQPAPDDLQHLADAYVLSTYSPHTLPRASVRGMLASWQRLWARLLLARLLYRRRVGSGR